MAPSFEWDFASTVVDSPRQTQSYYTYPDHLVSGGRPEPQRIVISYLFGDCFIVGGHFTLTGSRADILLGMLPPIVHIRKESDKAALRWSLERMREELRDPQPGGSLIAQRSEEHT